MNTPGSHISGHQQTMRRDHPGALVVGGIGLVRSVGVAGIPCSVGSDDPAASGLFSRYCNRKIAFPKYSRPEFIDELIAQGKIVGRRQVLLSDDDRAILNISKNRAALEPYYYTNFPEHRTVETLLDKLCFAALAEKLDLPVPRSITPVSTADLVAGTRKLTYPLILKPCHQEDWWHPDFTTKVGPYRKAIPCSTEHELVEYYARIAEVNPRVIVQELVTGSDADMCNADLYLDAHGKVLGFFIYRKHRSYPIHAGTGCFVETIAGDEIRDISFDVVQRLGMKGFANLQFKRDSRSGRLLIIEAHARVSIWEHLGTISGMNLIELGYFDMLGIHRPAPATYRTGVRGINMHRDLRALPAYLRTGEWTLGSWLASLRGTRYFHVVSLTDPLPFLHDAWQRCRQFVRDKSLTLAARKYSTAAGASQTDQRGSRG